nr:DNA repair helicase XPB1 [Tanacetum cinerariifolium]
MKWEADLHCMEMHTLIDLRDQTSDMVVAGVQCLIALASSYFFILDFFSFGASMFQGACLLFLLQVLSVGDDFVGLEILDDDTDDIALQKARAHRLHGSMSAMSGAKGMMYQEFRIGQKGYAKSKPKDLTKRHNMFKKPSYSGNEPGGMYSSSSYDGDYISRGSDVGRSSYLSSMYSGHSIGGSGYMGSGSSRSYY